jgi:hypothetical protein
MKGSRIFSHFTFTEGHFGKCRLRYNFPFLPWSRWKIRSYPKICPTTT